VRRSTIALTGIAALLGFVAGFALSLANGRALAQSSISALEFAAIAGVIVAALAWASGASERKGYSPWLGFVLVLILDVVGIVIILLLPAQNPSKA
jgi:ABC-type transport system involved in cytochrome c biogenesis permease subunit